MVCSTCGTGYDPPATACPKCGTPAGMLRPRVGPFARACLRIARYAALLNVIAAVAWACVLALNGHYIWATLLALLGVPVGIGHFVAFGLLIDFAYTP